jgi:hypothetical protein
VYEGAGSVLVLPGAKVQSREIIDDEELNDVSRKEVELFLQTGLGVTVKVDVIMPAFIVSNPMLKLLQPDRSVSINLGTYNPGVVYRCEIVSEETSDDVLPSLKSQSALVAPASVALKRTARGLQPVTGV